MLRDAPAGVAWGIINDHEQAPSIFSNINKSKVLSGDGQNKVVQQECAWKLFSLLSGAFALKLGLHEEVGPQAHRLSFWKIESAVFREFSGAWQVQALEGRSGCVVIHELYAEPAIPLSSLLDRFAQSLFEQEVRGILGDLEREVRQRLD